MKIGLKKFVPIFKKFPKIQNSNAMLKNFIFVLTLLFTFTSNAQESLIVTQIKSLEFEKKNLNSDKTSLNLEDLTDKIIILDFWATWGPVG